MNTYDQFVALHQRNEPLILGNAWDAASGRQLEMAGYQAIGTSSAACASVFGYEDGEGLSFEELVLLVKGIKSGIKVPLSVDIEGGYSRDPEVIVNNIQRLAEIGVAGVNLEDSIHKDQRVLLSAESFTETLKGVSEALKSKGVKIFLNIRSDAYLLKRPNALQETLQRITLYERNGADGIFVPGLVAENDLERVVHSTTLPVNVMCFPELPDFTTLQQLGVKRVSMGNFLHHYLFNKVKEQGEHILSDQSFNSLFLDQ